MIATLQSELTLKTNEQAQQRQDYEDLLVLLEDQDLKIKKYKVRTRVQNNMLKVSKITLEQRIWTRLSY